MSTISASAIPRSWRFWRTEPAAAAELKPEDDAMTVLRHLASQPNSAICLKAYLNLCNYGIPGLMSEEAIRERIIRTMQKNGLRHSAMREAIAKGFAAAKSNNTQQQSVENSESCSNK
jgi:hypothetical protein